MRKAKRHENAKVIDTGRFRDKVKFYRLVTVDDGFGGVTRGVQFVAQVSCEVLPMSYRAMQLLQLGGVTDFNKYKYMHLRSKKGFVITPDLVAIVNDSMNYTILGSEQLSNPSQYERVSLVFNSYVVVGIGGITMDDQLHPFINEKGDYIGGII